MISTTIYPYVVVIGALSITSITITIYKWNILF